MDRRRKYRRFLLWCIGLDMLALGILGYRYIDRKIPDEIRVPEGGNEEVRALLEHPLLTFDEAVEASGEGSYLLPCRLLGVIPFKDIKVTPAENEAVYVSGNTVGIYMETDGVLIIDTGEIVSGEGGVREPAKNIVQPGDYIVAFNEQPVSSKRELIEDLAQIDGGDVTLDVIRGGEEVPLSLTPVRDAEGDYKLGIWVRDNTQGIGTLTYVDADGGYGALGHGISDVDTGDLLHISTGALYQAEILGIRKGANGSPGELSGLIRYEPSRVLGSVEDNGRNGIYGRLNSAPGGLEVSGMSISSEIGNVSDRGNDSYENSVFGREDSFGRNSISDVGENSGGNGISDAGGGSGKDNETDTGSCLEWNGLSLRPMEVAYKQELETGPASILCCVGGEVREYDAEITRIDMNHEDSNKSFVIRVTDPDLLNATGGIVQGMSGSPVLQHNKFAGAVTHVFVQDSATGYGIFAETMLEQ